MHQKCVVLADGGLVVYPAGHDDAGEVVEIATGIDGEYLQTLGYDQVADELTLCHAEGGILKKITRQDHHEWTVEDMVFGLDPSFDPGLDLSLRNVETAIVTDGPGGQSVTLRFFVVDQDRIEHPYQPDFTGDDNDIYFWQPFHWSAGDALTVAWSGVRSNHPDWQAFEAADAAGLYNYGLMDKPDAVYLYTKPTETEPSVLKELAFTDGHGNFPDSTQWRWYDPLLVGYDMLWVGVPEGFDAVLHTQCDYVILDYGDANYRVYGAISRNPSDDQFGLIAETSMPLLEWGTEINPQWGIQPYDDRQPLADGAGTYPQAICFAHQRAWYVGTTAEPSAVDASRIGQLNSFGVHQPLLDDDAIHIDPASRQVQHFKHLLAQDDVVTAYADGGVFMLEPIGGKYTPTTTAFRQLADVPVSDLRPLDVGSRQLFTDRLGRVLELVWSEQRRKYVPLDRSIDSWHLFEGHRIVSWVYCAVPDRMIWAVRDDGVLLSCCAVTEREQWGWTSHTHDGTVLAVGSRAEGGRDVLYKAVQRTLGGVAQTCIERHDERRISDLDSCWFLDCASEYDGVPVSQVTAAHLAGASGLTALADGFEIPDLTADGSGQVTLHATETYSHVILGIPYTADCMPLPLNVAGEMMKGRRKTVANLTIHLLKSRGIKIGPDEDHLKAMAFRRKEAYDTATELYTGEKDDLLSATWSKYGQFLMRQDGPFPMTILAVIPEVDIGD